MAFPIRFKFVDKKTGEVVKGKGCLMLYPDGTPVLKLEDYYTYVRPISCANYELHVALSKDSEGHWDFKKVGY